jgi:DNA-binding transcriptional regulator of glucitol operon
MQVRLGTGDTPYRGFVRRYRFALRPRWLLWHLFTVAAVTTMILLGRWQLDVSESKHFNLQNFGYTIQWWLFAAFGLFLWWRVVRDAARRASSAAQPADRTPADAGAAADEPVAYRRYVMPSAAQPTDDPALAAYNEYLAGLAATDAKDAEDTR